MMDDSSADLAEEDRAMHAQMYRRKASSFRGVYRCGKKWKSQIQIDGVQYYLGVFPTEDRAAEEYRIAARRLGKSDESEYQQLFKEYGEGESDSEYMLPHLNKTQPGGTPHTGHTAHTSNSPHTVVNQLSSEGNPPSSYNRLPSLEIPGGSGVGSSAPTVSRTITDEKVTEDVKKTCFYLIPTNQLSLISAKVKLGKLGEEILTLSKICDEKSIVKIEEGTVPPYLPSGGPGSSPAKLIALRSALFHSLQQIRNMSTASQTQTRYKHSDLTDDETMCEV